MHTSNICSRKPLIPLIISTLSTPLLGRTPEHKLPTPFILSVT